MGHLARSTALMRSMTALGYNALLHLDADSDGCSMAQGRGYISLSALPDASCPLIIDAVNLTEPLISKLMAFYPRVLISPICDCAAIATHVLVRESPAALRAQLAPNVVLQVDPDFAFATAEHLKIRELDFSRLKIGIYFSGCDEQWELDALITVISQTPSLSEIRIISRSAPQPPGAAVKMRYVPMTDDPWEFFNCINVFLGGHGVMLAEAIAQGIPTFSLTTAEALAKNNSLARTGALRVLSAPETQMNSSPKPFTLLPDNRVLMEMHTAALAMSGPNRAHRLAKQLSLILKDRTK